MQELLREGRIVNTQGEMAPEKKTAKSSKAGPELARGIGREGRSKTYKRRGLWAIKKKNGGKFPVHEKKEKPAEPEGKVWHPLTQQQCLGSRNHCPTSAHVGAQLQCCVEYIPRGQGVLHCNFC